MRCKVMYVPWWRPIMLCAHTENGIKQVGWVWRQTVYAVDNLNHGWIAFVEDQTHENLAKCPHCGK